MEVCDKNPTVVLPEVTAAATPLTIDPNKVKAISTTTTTTRTVSPEIWNKAAKFISGEPIDQKNPFKGNNSRDEVDYPSCVKIVDSRAPPLTNNDNEDDISTEDVLRESKFVQTYIKNPDRYFTLDKDAIRQIQRDELKTKRPIPAQRRMLNNQPQPKVTNWKKHWMKDRYSIYPNLTDIKVRVGAATDEDDGNDVEYYNPAEVQFNAAQFDDRFKCIEFGSQDDIDSIAERTEALDGDTEKKREQIIKNNLQSETPTANKSYTNTVSSKEFKDYLRTKGLALVSLGAFSNHKATEKEPPKQVVTAAPKSDPTQNIQPLNGKKASALYRLLTGNRAPPRNAQFSSDRRPAMGTRLIHQNNANSPQVRQRHSTPIKSTQPPLGQLDREVQRPVTMITSSCTSLPYSNVRHVPATSRATITCEGDKNLKLSHPHLHMVGGHSQHSIIEPIYESTDRLLRQAANNRECQGPAANMNAGEGERHQPRSLTRDEIYAHLYAFYQKSKRNSISSTAGSPSLRSPSRNQSRNSG